MISPKKILLAICIVLAGVLALAFLFRLSPAVAWKVKHRRAENRLRCWVKVVNQDGKAVEGYKCEVVADCIPTWPFSRPKVKKDILETGPDGEFEYDSKRAVSFVVIGYWDSQWKLNPQHLMQRAHFGVSPLEHARAKSCDPINYPGSKRNPYVIHVFSVGSPQRLLYWNHQMKLASPGNWACIEILSGRVWESDKPEGDIAIRDNPFTEENIRGYCLESFVAGKQCGMYPMVDDWGLAPPENSYKTELCADRDWLAIRVRSGAGTAIYYRLLSVATGQYIYGRLAVGGSGRVRDGILECYTNLQGERNLFYKGYTDLFEQKIQDYVTPPVQ